jgi:hypothetical protein
MRLIFRLVLAAVVLVALFFGAIFAASEFGGEVVKLDSVDASGAHHTTHLWVVDDGGFAWLRAGVPTSGWLVRIEANPDVTVERGGVSYPMKAVPVREPVIRDRIHTLMREKYPWADRLISVMRDANGSVAVRLDPVKPPA